MTGWGNAVGNRLGLTEDVLLAETEGGGGA